MKTLSDLTRYELALFGAIISGITLVGQGNEAFRIIWNAFASLRRGQLAKTRSCYRRCEQAGMIFKPLLFAYKEAPSVVATEPSSERGHASPPSVIGYTSLVTS
jgi:hypothetical protein